MYERQAERLVPPLRGGNAKEKWSPSWKRGRGCSKEMKEMKGMKEKRNERIKRKTSFPFVFPSLIRTFD